MYVCMYVCMCVYVCMHACMHACTYIYIAHLGPHTLQKGDVALGSPRQLPAPGRTGTYRLLEG